MEGEDDEGRKKPSLAKLLKYGADPNSLSFEEPGERRTLLCLAIEEAVQLEDFAKVSLLLEAKADANRHCENGVFPLQLAAKHKHVPLARQLLQAKAEVNGHDGKLVTPLHTAVHQDDERLVQLLLLHQANVNALDKIGQPPVFFASSAGVIRALADRGADLLHLNKKGQCVLHLAAHNGADRAIACLSEMEGLRHLIDLQDERGRTPLHHAAARGHQPAVSRLMDIGADASLKTASGATAMSLADAKDLDVAYYIYTRVTGGNKASCSEMAQNPVALTLAAVLGVACVVNRKLLWDFAWDIAG